MNNILSTLGLCMRSGNLSSGDFAVSEAVRKRKAFLVIVALDASGNTKKKFRNMCSFYDVPILFYADQDTLGHAMGKEFRTSAAVTDAGFADEIKKQLTVEEE